MPPTLKEIYACYLALIRLGYTSEEISIIYGRLNSSTINETFIILNTQNKKMYLSTHTRENCVRLWEKHQDFLRNQATEKFIDQRWAESRYGTNPEEMAVMMQRLKKAGFTLPGIQVKAVAASLKSVDISEFGFG